MSEARCALVLADNLESVYYTAEIAKVLPKFIHKTEVDNRQQIRSGAGFLARNIPWTKAHELTASFNKAGYKTFCVPEALVQELPRPTRINRIKMHPKGIEGQVTYRWTPLIPWEDIASIHAYAFAAPRQVEQESKSKAKQRGVSVMGITSTSKHAQNILWNISQYEDKFSGFRITLYLDLLLLNPQKILRIEHSSFHFDCLPEVRQHSIDNFVSLFLLLKEEVTSKRSPGRPPLPARSELMSREATMLKYYLIDKEEERSNATRWLFLQLERPDIWPSLQKDSDDLEEVGTEVEDGIFEAKKVRTDFELIDEAPLATERIEPEATDESQVSEP